jgi:hypothetical protein
VGILVGIVVALLAVLQAGQQSDWITFGVLALVDLASGFVFVNAVFLGKDPWNQPDPTLIVVAFLAALGAPPLAALLSSLLAKQRLPRLVAIGVLAGAMSVLALAAVPPWPSS